MNRTELINKLIQKYNYQRYLEIGVDNGWCFNQIQCAHKDGVDPGSDDGVTDHGGDNNFKTKITYPTTSDEFFKKHAPFLEKYDIIFIDGLHHSDQVDKDIQNSLKYLNEGGSIILHDCNPLSKESQIVPRIQTDWHGDVWKSIIKYRNENDIGCITINTDCGLGVINSNLPKGPMFKSPGKLTYEWLEKNRTEALHLVSIEVGKYLLNVI